MRYLFFGLLLAVSAFGRASMAQDENATDFYAGRSPGLNSEQIAQGWISLFDGATLFGWRKEANCDWSIVDDTIQVSSGTSGLLRTPVQFDNFELRLEFKAPAETNSGIFIRTSPKPKSPTKGCIEINIASTERHPFPTGSIVEYGKAQAVELKEEFNAMKIVAMGQTVKVDINGKQVCEVTSEQFPGKGFIGLQHKSGQIQFRNIVLRPLAVEPIFNGRSLADWNDEQRLESKFSIADNVLNMKGGKGQLESVNQYADFIFSTHVRTNAQGLNSGVFFRCIPGDLMNGYESQIQNEFTADDRTKSKDHGTGGIFRRTHARIVNSNDQHWFAKTIVADGGTLCVWVNGLLVSDWTDNRKPHANPRNGRRLEKGTIILQGHDPTTDLSFKEIRARELMPRKR